MASGTCYEGGLRIPFIVRWPGRVKPGQASQELVSTVDLMPTFSGGGRGGGARGASGSFAGGSARR